MVRVETAKFKFVPFFYTQFGAKPPNLKAANISSYMIVSFKPCTYTSH